MERGQKNRPTHNPKSKESASNQFELKERKRERVREKERLEINVLHPVGFKPPSFLIGWSALYHCATTTTLDDEFIGGGLAQR